MKKLLLAFAILPLICPAQTVLTNYAPGATPEGAVYFLPKTALRISVLVEKTTYQPGDFAPYAQRYLKVAGVSQEPSVSYRVVGITQTPYAKADSTKAYSVKFDARSVAARVSLADDGRLPALNVPGTDDLLPPPPFTPAPKPAKVNPRQFMGEEILSCGSTAKMAELTAHEIYDLRENRSLLIKGQADFMPQDGKQMQLMLNELEQQDQALTSLFLGTTDRDTTEHFVFVMPSKPAPQLFGQTMGSSTPVINHEVLFRLSQVHGFTDADDLSGVPYYITVEDISSLPAPDPKAKKPKKEEQGIYVNIPGRMRSTIFEGITPVMTEEHPAPQFGQVQLLGAHLFNKRYTTRILLDPVSGSLKQLDADQPM